MDHNFVYSEFNKKFEISYKKEKAHFPMPPHTHNAIEIYLNLTEIPSVLLGSSMLSLQKNVLMIVPPYCVHQITPIEDDIYERYILTINSNWLDNLIGGGITEEFEYLRNANMPVIIRLSEEEKAAIIKKMELFIKCDEKQVFKKTGLFAEVMEQIHKKALSVSSKMEEHSLNELSDTAKTVSKILDYISENLYENICIEDIANHVFLNHDYINRIFKKHLNTSIRHYITIQRITRSQQLLLEGYSVSQIQEMVGYGSYEHFFRTFKKVTGLTPKEYRNQILGE